jgi:hypothetical protein
MAENMKSEFQETGVGDSVWVHSSDAVIGIKTQAFQDL